MTERILEAGHRRTLAGEGGPVAGLAAAEALHDRAAGRLFRGSPVLSRIGPAGGMAGLVMAERAVKATRR